MAGEWERDASGEGWALVSGRYGWGYSEVLFHDAVYPSHEAAYAAARKEGATGEVWTARRGEVKLLAPGGLADDIEEAIADQLFEQIGEAYESWRMSDEAKLSLVGLVDGWLAKHVSPDIGRYWVAEDARSWPEQEDENV